MLPTFLRYLVKFAPPRTRGEPSAVSELCWWGCASPCVAGTMVVGLPVLIHWRPEAVAGLRIERRLLWSRRFVNPDWHRAENRLVGRVVVHLRVRKVLGN